MRHPFWPTSQEWAFSFTASDQMLPSDPGNALSAGQQTTWLQVTESPRDILTTWIRATSVVMLGRFYLKGQACCLILFCWQSNFLQSINGLFYLFNTTNLALWVSRRSGWSAVAAERAPCTGQGRMIFLLSDTRRFDNKLVYFIHNSGA